LVANGTNERITVHHNLFAHNDRRNPWVKDNAKVEIIFCIHDNFGLGRTEDAQDDWDAVDVGQFDPGPYRVDEPLTEIASGLKAQKPAEAYESVLTHAGAVPHDKADTRAVADTRS